MFKINFFISEKTLTLENSRELETMSLEDIIYWCFLTRVNFEFSSKPLLLLPEVCLFQIVDGLSHATKEILTTSKSQTVIDDKYGSFTLFIEKHEDVVVIREQSTKTKFQVPRKEFVKGSKDFVNSVISLTKNLFPHLYLNLSYIALVKNWQKGVSEIKL